MSAHQGEGRQTTVDNAVALRALADELRGSSELGRCSTYTAVLGDIVWGRATVSPTTLAPPRVLTAPLGSRLSTARGHSTLVRVSRSNRTGRLYYALRLAYYPRVDRVGPLARGVTIARQYLYRGCPVSRRRRSGRCCGGAVPYFRATNISIVCSGVAGAAV
jgi:hypothetical protein